MGIYENVVGVCVVATLVYSGMAQADTVYRCQQPGAKPAYQDKPCAPNESGGVAYNTQRSQPPAPPSPYDGYFTKQAEEKEAKAEQRRQAAQQKSADRSRTYSNEEIDEQKRRCNMEQTSLARSGGGECTTLQIMLSAKTGVALPPQVTVSPNAAPQRIFDSSTNRWCWVYPTGPTQCD